jgi:hypothetical protein
MSDEIRVGRPVAPGVRPEPQGEYRGGGSSKLPWVILVIVVIVIIVVAVLFRDKWGGGSKDTPMKASEYQAVFLTNGQVYFGKMSNAHDAYVTLKDIFYLQVQNPPIQGSQEEQQAQAQQQQPQLSLVKLGQELHGPVDEMHINREQILFYEDMKEDAKVMQAIKEYKANPNAGQQQGGVTPPPASGQQGQQQTPPPAAPTPTPTPTSRPSTQQ